MLENKALLLHYFLARIIKTNTSEGIKTTADLNFMST